MQDPLGYMYFGTEDGLVIYDGVGYQIFHERDGLPGTPVLAIQSVNEKVWVATPRGLGIFDGTSFQPIEGWGNGFFRCLATGAAGQVAAGSANGLWIWNQNDAKALLPESDIRELLFDGNDLFIGTANGDVFKLDARHRLKLIGTTGHVVRGLTRVGGTLYISSNAGLFQWSESRDWDQVSGLPDYPFSSITHNQAGELWIGTWGVGLICFKPESGHYDFYDTNHGIPTPFITDIMTDYEDSLWICTRDGGIAKLSQPEFEFYDLSHLGAGTHIVNDHKNRLWFAGPQLGLARLNAPTNEVQKMLSFKKPDLIFFMLADHKERIFLLKQDGVFVYQGNELEAVPTVMKDGVFRWAAMDSENDIWFGGSSGLGRLTPAGAIEDMNPDPSIKSHFRDGARLSQDAMIFTTKEQIWIYDNRVFKAYPFPSGFTGEPASLATDKEGTLAIATDRGLLIRTTDEHWHSYLEGEPVTALLFDEQRLFAATRQNVISIQNGHVQNLYGLAHAISHIQQIIKDQSGQYWFIAHNMVISFSNGTWSEMAITDHDSVPGILAAVLDNNGQPWFSTTKGIVAYDAARKRPHTPAPRIAVTINPGDHRIADGQTLYLPANHHPLNLSVRALSYINEDLNSFLVDISGPAPSREFFTANEKQLAPLPAGKSVIKIWAINAAGIQSSNPITTHVNVAPAYWNTLTFRWLVPLALALVIWLFTVLFSRYRTRRLSTWNRQLERELAIKSASLVEAKNLETANALMVTLSHEITQPLAAIQGSLDLLKLDEAHIAAASTNIQSALNSIMNILRRLRHIDQVRFADYTPGVKMVALGPDDSHQVSRKNRSVLFVDDDPMLLEIWTTYFQELGYLTLHANSGDQGFEIFEYERSHLGMIISDNKMPGLSGFEFYKKVRAIDADIPFYIFTGYDCGDDLSQELRASLSGIIRKPIRLRELQAVIESHLTVPN